MVAIASSTLLAEAAQAQTAPQRLEVALDYAAPATCPSATEFWLAVQTRSHRVERVSQDSTDIVVRVQLREVGAKTRGELQIIRSGTPTDSRSVTGPACADVVDALALTTVLGLDPDAVLTAPEEETSATPPSEGVPAPTSETQPQQQPREEDTRDDEDTEEEYPNERPTFIGSSSGGSDGVALAIGGSFVLTNPTQQGPNIGAEIAVGIVPRTVAFTSPRVDLAVSMTDNGPVGDTTRMRLNLVTGELRACPIEVAPVPILRFRPCVAFQAGRVEATGTNITAPQTTQNLWLSLGVAAQLALFVTDHLNVHLSGAAQFPLTHQQYFVGTPAELIGETAALNPWLAIGVGYEFR